MDTKQFTQQYRQEKWSQIICHKAESGLSVRAFCQREGINEKSYYYWLKKIRAAACQVLPNPSGVKFALLEPPSQPLAIPTKITIHCGHLSMDVYDSTSEALLKNTLRIMRQMSQC